MQLTLSPNIADPDGFYQELIDSQRDMSEAEAELMNCKLILILANHIGDREALRQALAAPAARSIERSARAWSELKYMLNNSSCAAGWPPMNNRNE